MARQKIQLEITGDSRSVERAFKNAGKAGSGFGRTMKNVAKVAAVGFGAAIVGVGLALKRGFGELIDAQKVAAQTAAVLKSTGGVANVTAKHVDKMAGALSRMSGIDDELIAGGSNLLLTFTNIRNGVGKGNRIFDRATAAVLDMSIAFHKDIPTSAIMLGKALNDTQVNAKGTITGWSALRRIGVKVTDSMMKQAAAFIKAGKPMEAQKLLLHEIAVETAGSAKAFGGTMAGALGKLNNALDEVLGSFAQGFLPVILKVANALNKKLVDPAFVARVQALGTLIGTKLLNAFNAISAWFQANWGGIQSGFQTAVGIVRRMHTIFMKIAGITPGGPETLLGIIAGGILLSKLGLLNKLLFVTLTRMRLIAATTMGGGGGGGAGGAGGKAGKLGKVAKVARGVGKATLIGAAAAGVAGVLTHKADAANNKLSSWWNSMNAAQQRKAMIRNNWTNADLKIAGLKMKPEPPIRQNTQPGHVPMAASPVLPINLHMDGKKVGSVVLKRNQRAGKQTSASRRGPFAGQRLALG